MTPSELESLSGAYVRDGYVAVEGVLGKDEIEALKAEAFDIATGRRGDILGAGARTAEAVNAEVLAIHFPNKVSQLMRDALRHPRIVQMLTALIGPNVKAMQSILFVKGPGQRGQAWHQDEHFIPTRDRSLCGVWIALDDATVENGCLWFHPGSQRPGVLWRMQAHADDRFDASEEAQDHPFPREGGAPVELRAGGVAFFHGYVLHRSLPNRTVGQFRRALVNHYMSAESLLPWSVGFPPVRRQDYRDIEIVAGEDPYAWKGVTDESLPFVRPVSATAVAEFTDALAARTAALRRAAEPS